MLAWTRTAVALLAFWFAGLGPAQAAWRAVDGIDVSSGKPSLLLIGDLDVRTALYARCIDGHAELFLDGFDGGDFEIAPVGPVNLFIATDTGKSWSSEARYGREKQGYITATWLTRETIGAVVAELAAAKSAISISIEFAESGDVSVWDTDAKGSTAAGKRFLQACPPTRFSGLPEPASPSQPQAEPPRPDPAPPAPELPPETPPDADTPANPLPASSAEGTATWQTFITDAAEATLVGELERNARLLATCDSGKNVTLSLVAPDLPYQIGDLGLNLHLDIDGADRVSTGEVFNAAEGLTGVAYTGEYVAGAIQALAEARTGIGLRVQNYADGSLVAWDAPDLDGLVAATNSFNATCFGTAPRQAVADAPVAPGAGPSRIQSDAGFDPTLDWAVALGDQVTLPEVNAVLMGRTSPAPGYLQVTCGTDRQNWSLGLVASDPSALGMETSDGPFTIGLEVDGSPFAFPNGQSTASADGFSVIAEAGTDLAGALIMMSLSFNPVTLTVTGASGESHTYTIGIAGMGEASGAMSQACLG